MDNAQRISKYGGREKFSGALLDLTPAQRRRVRRKGRSRKTHGHARDPETGKLTCLRCRPSKRLKLDSPVWRAP